MRSMRSPSKLSLSMKQQVGVSSAGQSVGTRSFKTNQPPKPEPLTDKQILRRLNEEIRHSRIFSRLHIKKLPDTILREI